MANCRDVREDRGSNDQPSRIPLQGNPPGEEMLKKRRRRDTQKARLLKGGREKERERTATESEAEIVAKGAARGRGG